ncbi:molybdopterin-dependent oxidoreductase [Saccharopolyspora sp. K220]|uniref:xanthine dehydrogenase family protein molybdopterin-binding subunit n=1 Tax=Saccharopolyspora soli TaxID=2926618 RepID=UPI001F563A0B|nr:molybdopterin cofactor-binding domain-containing protein [Saccharopolyspora soli]MCI2417951.1 molybdopterin-dependent oxidoreductase [Saccharopolyspora soli]
MTAESELVLSRWVTITADGIAEVRVGKVEIGQGVLTALGQLAADELDLSMARIRMLPARTGRSPDEGLTAGSLSMSTSGPTLRLVCANVRALLLAEAARRWQVDVAELEVADGRIQTTDGTRRTTYGELSGSVDLDVEARTDIPPKAVGDLRIAGTDVDRLDLPDKIAGRDRFISDLRLPGLLFGRVVRPPSPGARLLEVDDTVVAPDVQVVRDGSFLGVVGDDEAEVVRAAEQLRQAANWAESAELPEENDLVAFLKRGPHETTPVIEENTAAATGKRLSAQYSRPFLAHASIAPSCGVARWTSDGTVSVWSHSQGIYQLRKAIADTLELDVEAVCVQHVDNAGCYGHNAADDAAFDAVLLARAVPTRPVQVLWSRQDELAWSPFGSAMAVDVAATVDDTGQIQSWDYDVFSQGHISRPGYAGVPGLLAGAYLAGGTPAPAATDPPLPAAGTARNAIPGYQLGNRRITAHRLLETPIRSSALRSLGAFVNVFAIESFMDELAAEAGRDPLEYRLAHLTDDRARQVLETAAAAAGWHDPAPAEIGRGIGFARYKGSGAYCAVVAEVEAEHDIRVRNLTIAVDVGFAVNPGGVRNQIEGGATQATSWTLKEQVRFDKRRITSDDWESYPILRFSEVPRIEVELVPRPDAPIVGAGEAAQGPTAGAIANAVADAIGVRVRDLPITRDAVVAAIESADA